MTYFNSLRIIRLTNIELYKPITFSVPEEQFKQIEKQRGLVSRSKYLQHLLDACLKER